MLGRDKLVLRLAACVVLAGALAVVLSLAATPSPARSVAACTPSWQVVPDPLFVVDAVAADSPTDAWAAGLGSTKALSTSIEHWDGQRWSVSWTTTAPVTLTGVAAASPSAAWVVGYRNYSDYSGRSQLVERWDGARWRAVRTPAVDGLTWFTGVVAVAADDVWAVGGKWVRPGHLTRPRDAPLNVDTGVTRTLIEHWDGTSWQVVPNPNIGRMTLVRSPHGKEPASVNQLFAVAADSADDIWAVGEHAEALPLHKKKWHYASRYLVTPLVEHWNGTSWTLAPPPPQSITLPLAARGLPFPAVPLNGLGLNGVSVSPSGDVLAVHTPDQVVEGVGPAFQSVWLLNGASWSPLSGYRTAQDPFFALTSAIVTAHDDAWVSGYDVEKSPPIAHWDGNQWALTRLSARGTAKAAAATGPEDVWEAGVLGTPNATYPYPKQERAMLHYTC
jgi:hypothetical protein